MVLRELLGPLDLPHLPMVRVRVRVRVWVRVRARVRVRVRVGVGVRVRAGDRVSACSALPECGWVCSEPG